MTQIHRTAARGFDAGADAYERARPGYPAACLDFLVARLRLLDGRVLDLAAGTGKMTRALLARGMDCVAVEPVEGMRRAFRAALPGVPVLGGTAEAIPLPDGGVAAIVVAQAFHWFRHDDALAEMHRVLAPGGRVGIVWNVRDERVAWVAELSALLRRYEGADGVAIPRHGERRWRAPLERTRLFRMLDQREFEHGHEMNAEGLVDRMASISFIATLPDGERATALREVRRLAERHPDLTGRERFAFPYIAETFVLERA